MCNCIFVINVIQNNGKNCEKKLILMNQINNIFCMNFTKKIINNEKEGLI